MLTKDNKGQIHMGRDRIMGNNNNNNSNMLNKLQRTDNNTKAINNRRHTNKVMLNKVMPNKHMLDTDNNKVTMLTVRVEWAKDNPCHLLEKNKCLTTVLLLNHNLMDQQGRRIHQRK